MRYLLASAALAAAFVAVPAHAQDRDRSAQPSPLAQQAMASGQQPDVLLDVPNLSVDELTIKVDRLEAHISLDARLANLLQLKAGADVLVDNVEISLKGVQAQATLIVRLENVRAIIERTLQTLDSNPEIVERLLTSVDNTVGTVGGVANNALPVVGNVANNALPVVGNVANNAVDTVGSVANNALRNGQVLNLAAAGLREVSRTVNGAGQTVRQVTDSTGRTLEVVTDSANRIVSSRALGQ